MAFFEKVADLLIPSAQAFDTHEHIQVVDDACRAYMFNSVVSIKIKNPQTDELLRFTLGEISSLAGDYYATPLEFIQNAAKARKFLDENKENFRKGEVGQQPACRLTDGKYLDLAIVNFDHFRNDEVAPCAMASMKRYHELARKVMYKHVGSPSRGIERTSYGYLLEGFALHYAMDLFAAGHLRTPRYAVYRYLKESLGYRDRNAAICAALLSDYNHHIDNETGLMCNYLSCSDMRQWGIHGYRVHQFYGDKCMKRNSQEVMQHMHEVVFSMLTHVNSWHSILRHGAGKSDPSPWTDVRNMFLLAAAAQNPDDENLAQILDKIEDGCTFDEFARCVFPVPAVGITVAGIVTVPVDENVSPIMEVNSTDPISIKWNGPESFTAYDIFRVKVSTKSNILSGIEIGVPVGLVPGVKFSLVAALSGVIGLGYSVYAGRPAVTMDGNDARLLNAFQSSKSLLVNLPVDVK